MQLLRSISYGIIGMAAETNALATALQIPIDPEFEVG
jgi:hypothetical protein